MERRKDKAEATATEKEKSKMNVTIRREQPGDFRAVEALTREAFWNVNVPGCGEHYLAHILREHPDFVPELDLVLEADGVLAANIMYTKAKLADECGKEKEILTFGPLSVLPAYQRRGLGKQLLAHSFAKAAELGYDVIVIFGNPENYISSGFKNAKRCNISLEGGLIPVSLLVRELKPGALDGRHWTYMESPAYAIEEAAAEEFDREFAPKEKAYRPSQELFYIYSHSAVVR
jgi:putative acetyltransferase